MNQAEVRKKVIEIAKTEQKYIVELSISGMCVPLEVIERQGGKIDGVFRAIGPATVEEANEFFDLWERWRKRRAAEMKARSSNGRKAKPRQ